MEYVGKCPQCGKHTLVSTVKQIVHDKTRKPQRKDKCVNCGNLARITLIGEVTNKAESPSTVNPEYATANRLVFKLWD